MRDSGGRAGVGPEAVAAFGRLDILVCSAGITADARDLEDDRGAVGRGDRRQPEGMLQLQPGRGAACSGRTKRDGSCNIASINGLRGKFGQANYAASKGGVIALSKALARELGRYDVNVNAIAPGMVRTEMTRGAASASPGTGDRRERSLGRLADPEDCADARGVPVLGPGAAHHGRGDPGRRWPVHLISGVTPSRRGGRKDIGRTWQADPIERDVDWRTGSRPHPGSPSAQHPHRAAPGGAAPRARRPGRRALPARAAARRPRASTSRPAPTWASTCRPTSRR